MKQRRFKCQQTECRKQSQRCSVFAVTQIQRPVKLYVGCLLRCKSCQARQKKRHRRRILFIFRAENLPQILGFLAHHRQIQSQKPRRKKRRRPPSRAADCKTQTDQKTAEVKRISGARVRTGNSQNLVFAQMTGSPRANQQTDKRNRAANAERPPNRTSREQKNPRADETERNAPSLKFISYD